ncbi:MAG: hypothetical protein RBR16_03870 [Syntrophus sp. (in: bacteria)]|nr:hypothetical protein [Syntrophus sp. (in: bacteria)]
MDEIAKISVIDFEKKSDGSWVSLKNAAINTKGGLVITVPRGMPFKKGFTYFGGFDVVKALEEAGVN